MGVCFISIWVLTIGTWKVALIYAYIYIHIHIVRLHRTECLYYLGSFSALPDFYVRRTQVFAFGRVRLGRAEVGKRGVLNRIYL